MARITISAAAKRGFASRPTLYRAIKDGRLTAVQDGERKTIDLSDLVTVFGEPGARQGLAAAKKPDIATAVEAGRIEADRDRLAEENDRLRRERDQARREAGEERDQARQERDRLLGLVEASQKLLEDQGRERKRGWWQIFGKGTVAALLLSVLLIGGTAGAAGTAIVFGSGQKSCGSWTEAKENNTRERLNFVSWMSGYLSAYGLWVEKGSGPVNRQSDAMGILAWIDNYCQENPLDRVDVAAVKVIFALEDK